ILQRRYLSKLRFKPTGRGHVHMHFSVLSQPPHVLFFLHYPTQSPNDGWNNGEHNEHGCQEQHYHKLGEQMLLFAQLMVMLFLAAMFIMFTVIPTVIWGVVDNEEKKAHGGAGKARKNAYAHAR